MLATLMAARYPVYAEADVAVETTDDAEDADGRPSARSAALAAAAGARL